jgi:hypothetical protein
VVLVRYFDASHRLWLTSLGLSLIIGFALVISTRAGIADGVKLGFWSTVRLFLMPFCVSSFAALVKGKGFFLIFSPKPLEIGVAAGGCLLLWGIVVVVKRTGSKPALPASPQRPRVSEALKARNSLRFVRLGVVDPLRSAGSCRWR